MLQSRTEFLANVILGLYHNFKARRLNFFVWPLLIMSGMKPASAASEVIQAEVLLKVWTFGILQATSQLVAGEGLQVSNSRWEENGWKTTVPAYFECTFT